MGSLAKWRKEPWLVVVVITAILIALVAFRNSVYPHPGSELPHLIAEDSDQYRMMAIGNTQDVIAPFAKRFLYPFLVRCLFVSTGLPLNLCFMFFDLAGLVLLTYCLAKILIEFGLSPWIASVFLLTPVTVDQIELGYLPDLFHAGLMALFFLMLQLHRYIWALLTLALCFMTREDTMACAAILGLLAWRRNHRVLAIGALGVILFGMAFGSWCLRSGHTNIHGLPDFCYLALKLPYNFLKNVLGCSIWTNVLTGVGEPFLKFTLPHCLQWGGDREIGLCYPEAGRPLFTLISLLSLFGSGPLILWANRRMKLWSDDHPLMVQLVFIYGLCVYFLGTSLGDWVDRLIGHSWPLFWICIPYLLAKRQPPFRIKETRALVLSLIIIAWLPSLLNYSRYASNLWALATLTILVIAYVFAAKQLRKIPNREVST